MKYCNIRLDQYELSRLKSAVMSEYQKEKLRLETADNYDKDIISDSIIRLQIIQGKLNNAILISDTEVD